ncbi:MAG: PAS domain S-box protein, partial [Candidatus Binatia bacterium]
MTLRRQASPARDESAERDATRFEAIFESAPDAILVISGDGRIAFANREVERTFGHRRNELVGRPIETLLPKVDGVHGFVGRRGDGTEFPVEVNVGAFEGADGPTRIAVVRDVTERRLVERRLRERERQLEIAQQVAQLGSWEYDARADRVSWSDELFRIYGL